VVTESSTRNSTQADKRKIQTPEPLQEFAALEQDNSRLRIPEKPDLRARAEERMVEMWLP
jgi:hypothetical protein